MLTKYKVLLVVFFFILFMGVTNVFAAIDSWKDWSFYSPIDLKGNSKYKAIYLSEEVYQHSLADINDLRLVDKDGNTVPYYIQHGQTATEQGEIFYQGELIATAQEDNNTKLDFRIKPIRENSDIIGNMLEFSLPEQNFLKHLIIQGSFDGNNWVDVGKDFIYRTEDLQKNMISLNGTYKYNYYRITIVDNAELITLPKLQLVYHAIISQQKLYEKSIRLNYEINEGDKETVITLANPERLRIKEINLDVDGNFQRHYSLYDSNNNMIRVNGSKELYNLNFKEIEIANTSILFNKNPVSANQITLKIDNNDNPPLNIKGISVNYYIDKIVFEDNGTGPYKLYYGNQLAKQPQYDLKLFQSYIEKEKQDIVRLGKAVNQNENIPDSNIPSWLTLKNIFNVVIVLISLVLIIILVKKLNN